MRKGTVKTRRIRRAAVAVGLAASLACAAASAAPSGDAMRAPRLRDVRIGSVPGVKLAAFVRARMQGAFAQKEIFGEARRAFETRDDDVRGHGGLWRGEFWGKLMLGTARVADYLQDPALLAFVQEECRRLMALQDADGYLGSYRDKELVSITDPALTTKVYGWLPCWNLWNRKYTIWGMLAAYKATGDRAILDSVVRQADQWIDMMHRRGLRLHETGTPGFNGMPSMSVLKPLLLLHAETGERKYLDYAAEMLPDWDREDGACPNFFRNAGSGKDLADWYPEPWAWAKGYELMSCLDGLLEYRRVTGDARSLETVAVLRDNLATSEANPFGGVGYGDKFVHAAQRLNALSELCDAIHWIRLNLDLFEITGDGRYMDAVETAYLNNFLPGVFRRGDYGAFFVRGQGRHEFECVCGYAYNHCCVNNMARTWMDVAEGTVTRDRAGTFHVNLYQDASVTLDGVRFGISGDYPVGNDVTVRLSEKAPVEFRRPSWCKKMDVEPLSDDGKAYRLTFAMPARLVERDLPPEKPIGKDRLAWWAEMRYTAAMDGKKGRDVRRLYLKTAAATLWRGPLLLAKAKRVGDTEAEIFPGRTVNLKGASVTLAPCGKAEAAAWGVWGAWTATLAVPGEEPVRVKVCDFQSAGDDPRGEEANAFSIWF